MPQCPDAFNSSFAYSSAIPSCRTAASTNSLSPEESGFFFFFSGGLGSYISIFFSVTKIYYIYMCVYIYIYISTFTRTSSSLVASLHTNKQGQPIRFQPSSLVGNSRLPKNSRQESSSQVGSTCSKWSDLHHSLSMFSALHVTMSPASFHPSQFCYAISQMNLWSNILGC